MKLGVPTWCSYDGFSIIGRTSGCEVSLAVPKSIRRRRRSFVRRKFSHLISLCTIPALWQTDIASTIWQVYHVDSSSTAQPQFLTRAQSSPPSHHSRIATHSSEASNSQNRVTMCSDASKALKQWASIAHAWSKALIFLGTIFMAYWRLVSLSVHCITSQNDPVPRKSPLAKFSRVRNSPILSEEMPDAIAQESSAQHSSKAANSRSFLRWCQTNHPT
mmetsp:Transcript_44627/g.105823  ORF Transcript_44627/g.105823 Transcript_44627/m.105823 type:complete len:218 (-) Transcript_44627:63-716(-)